MSPLDTSHPSQGGCSPFQQGLLQVRGSGARACSPLGDGLVWGESAGVLSPTPPSQGPHSPEGFCGAAGRCRGPGQGREGRAAEGGPDQAGGGKRRRGLPWAGTREGTAQWPRSQGTRLMGQQPHENLTDAGDPRWGPLSPAHGPVAAGMAQGWSCSGAPTGQEVKWARVAEVTAERGVKGQQGDDQGAWRGRQDAGQSGPGEAGGPQRDGHGAPGPC